MSNRPDELAKERAKRGTKRTCERDDCGRRFYDLNKLPTSCPFCGTAFAVPVTKAIEPCAGSRVNFKSYRIEQEPAKIADAADDPPAVKIEDDGVAEPAADDIPEIEDEDIDETLSVDVEGRNET